MSRVQTWIIVLAMKRTGGRVDVSGAFNQQGRLEPLRMSEHKTHTASKADKEIKVHRTFTGILTLVWSNLVCMYMYRLVYFQIPLCWVFNNDLSNDFFKLLCYQHLINLTLM